MEKKFSKRAIRNLLFIAGTVLIVFLAILLYDSPGYTTYIVPPDIAEWLFIETPEEIVEKHAFTLNARIDEDGNLVFVLRNDKKKKWLEGIDTSDFDSAMQNENIQISSDFTHISIIYNERTHDADCRTAEGAALVCVYKQLANGAQPKDLVVIIDVIDGITGKIYHRFDYISGTYKY